MVPARALVAVIFVFVSASCGGEDGGSGASSTTSAAATTTVLTSSTTVAAGSTTAAPSTVPPYGSPCQAGSHPDCIDPDGDGEYEYLQGGSECIKTLGIDSGLCSDLDGDGRAGYPDAG